MSADVTFNLDVNAGFGFTNKTFTVSSNTGGGGEGAEVRACSPTAQWSYHQFLSPTCPHKSRRVVVVFMCGTTWQAALALELANAMQLNATSVQITAIKAGSLIATVEVERGSGEPAPLEVRT